ncbi:cytochrome c oxidase subunit 4 isoform 1, mitochondrial-like [Mizuhopecten yessoensis]|uniref:Cytochrome c oxidase subunit 4 n=1 Tax=Mizuhopecten yessoensis TaxID=6573 RepID=A0A210QH47_MIZYE|nr:cytochrome c oxidase subunit 4 isoform 1, mitochondrial-like [Mizuhopecten yessoensis]XP_021358358.1 cytochrome c oxidase subunit 4 isoform 1, mitochondrial-like [Mizuhopecten yessoensis]OWF48062.1 Cytochrome c oxidase subunit 4 isoform 2, mitochondrial [Mizuhopecten yessoensis]
MSGQLILRRLGNKIRWQQVRSCTAVVNLKQVQTYPMEQTSQEIKDKYYPMTGERDIVGHGLANEGLYVDDYEWPCSGVRFKANTPEILALREKESNNDWGKLTLEDKKDLYRASYAQTFEEMLAPTGEWKRQLIIFLFGCFTTQLLIWAQEDLILPAPSAQLSEGHMEAIVQNMINQRKGIMYGLASRYDYSKGEYKPGMQPKGSADK